MAKTVAGVYIYIYIWINLNNQFKPKKNKKINKTTYLAYRASLKRDAASKTGSFYA